IADRFATNTIRQKNELPIFRHPGPFDRGSFFSLQLAKPEHRAARVPVSRPRSPIMTRNQIQQMVDELAEDLRAHVFQVLDAEIWINGEEASRMASTIERAFRHELDSLFDVREPTNGQVIPPKRSDQGARR